MGCRGWRGARLNAGIAYLGNRASKLTPARTLQPLTTRLRPAREGAQAEC